MIEKRLSLVITLILVCAMPAFALTGDYYPTAGLDESNGGYTLLPDDLAKLTASDNNQYTSHGNWKSRSYTNNDYIKFDFEPNISFSASIKSVIIKFEWQRSSKCENMNHVRLLIWDYSSSSWRVRNLAPSFPSYGVDRTEVINVSSYINTPEDLNNLKIWFQGYASYPPAGVTKHDLVKVTVTYKMPCDYFTDEFSCQAENCGWCPECSGSKVNQWNQGKCVNIGTSCSYQCEKDYCGAECGADADCNNYCYGDTRYYTGACSDSCSCNYLTENCNSYDGWYDTGNEQWVSDSACTEKEQKEQEQRDYYCDPAGCSYSVTGTQWLDTGNTRNKPDGTSCDDGFFCTVNDQCSSGVCADDERTCDDSISCTIDSCDEANDVCVNAPDNSYCDNNLWCDGNEYCDTSLGCQADVPIDCSDSNECTSDSCNEASDQCENTNLPDGALCGQARDCTDSLCIDPFWWVYPQDGHDYCISGFCTEYSCDSTEHYCCDNDQTDGITGGNCNAECDQNTDCTCPADGCVGNDWHDYPDYGNCLDNCSCNISTGDSQPCHPEITYNDARCVPCDFYTDSLECNSNARCSWCPECSGSKVNQWNQGKCVNIGTSCSYQCEKDYCGAECGADADCNNYCSGDTRYYSGACSNSCSCTSYLTEDCNSYDGWYDTGNEQWVSDSACTEKEQEEQEQRDYYCDPAGCDYSVTETQWLDTGNTRNKSDGSLCGQARDCTDSLCIDPFWWVYPQDGHDYCISGFCTEYSCDNTGHYCCDNDQTDGITGGNCNAECDQNEDCAPRITDDICYYGADGCNTEICTCIFQNNKYCPEPGTVSDGVCYYGEGTCTENGCSLNESSIRNCEYCDPVSGPADITPPFVTDIEVDSAIACENASLSAVINDPMYCSNISEAEYFLGNESGCGDPGTGTPMGAADGLFDSSTEGVEADIAVPCSSGAYNLWIRGRDAAGNWGNCKFYLLAFGDGLPTTYNVSVEDTIVTATIEGFAVAAEYFIDEIGPVGSGTPMNAADGEFNSNIEDVIAELNENLSVGSHTVYVHGKNSEGYWGNFGSAEFVIYEMIPNIDITNPVNSWYKGTVTVSYTTEGIECHYMYINNGTESEWFPITCNNDFVFDTNNCTDGSNICTIDVRTRKWSFYGYDSVTFSVDNSAPIITYVSLSSSQVEQNSSINITSDGHDPQGLLSCYALLMSGDTQVKSYNLGLDCSDTELITGVPDGDYIIRVRARNNAYTDSFAEAPLKIGTTFENIESTGTVQHYGGFYAAGSGKCTEKWVCTAWNECIDGNRTRSCIDENHCNTTEIKPNEKIDCKVNIPEEEVEGNATETIQEINSPGAGITGLFLSVISDPLTALIIIIGIIILAYLIRRFFRKASKSAKVKN